MQQVQRVLRRDRPTALYYTPQGPRPHPEPDGHRGHPRRGGALQEAVGFHAGGEPPAGHLPGLSYTGGQGGPVRRAQIRTEGGRLNQDYRDLYMYVPEYPCVLRL